jgi:hypothetical protein
MCERYRFQNNTFAISGRCGIQKKSILCDAAGNSSSSSKQQQAAAAAEQQAAAAASSSTKGSISWGDVTLKVIELKISTI